MTKWSFYNFLFLLALCFSACNKDDGSENTEPSVIDEYYVKYEYRIHSSPNYTNGINVIFCNEKGTDITTNYKISVDSHAVIGPIKKGFKAKLKLQATYTPNPAAFPPLYGQISISKNGSPFVLKSSGNDSPTMEINYTVQ